MGLEPTTPGTLVGCSTEWATRAVLFLPPLQLGHYTPKSRPPSFIGDMVLNWSKSNNRNNKKENFDIDECGIEDQRQEHVQEYNDKWGWNDEHDDEYCSSHVYQFTFTLTAACSYLLWMVPVACALFRKFRMVCLVVWNPCSLNNSLWICTLLRPDAL